MIIKYKNKILWYSLLYGGVIMRVGNGIGKEKRLNNYI